VRATGFFSDEEEAVAAELVEERLAKGKPSGYEFVFAEQAETLVGYSCYGLIPLTRSSFDLYWIVVHPAAQGSGIGRQLMEATEAAVAGVGGTAVYAETSSREQYAPTRAFYRATGYTLAADFPDFYAPGDGKVVFVKRLT
jgi:ribosomal protein S18 acetylase RimI-like enzyme